MTVDSGPCGVGARHLYMSLVFTAYGGVCVPDIMSIVVGDGATNFPILRFLYQGKKFVSEMCFEG